jgi:uncharacterized protein (DUF1697 family)
MPVHCIALLRAINVGGNSNIRMAELRKLGESLGFSGVKTLLQSGNMVFNAREADTAVLEQQWETAVERQLGVKTSFRVRSQKEWLELVAANPFEAEATQDPSHLLALIARDAIGQAAIAALRGAIRGRERIEAGERCLYAVYPDGIGGSKLTVKLIERQLSTPVTGRNWNTVLKLAAL